MSTAMGTFEWHMEQLGQHPCCCIVQPDAVRCGLWCGHGGDHLPYVPGDYLAVPPQLSPLGQLRGRKGRCPVCSRLLRSKQPWPWGGWLWELPEAGDAGLYVWEISGSDPVMRSGVLWRFVPCGCETFEAWS